MVLYNAGVSEHATQDQTTTVLLAVAAVMRTTVLAKLKAILVGTVMTLAEQHLLDQVLITFLESRYGNLLSKS